MAQSQLKVEAVMKGTFPLQVAVRCTEDAETLCWKNRLSFSDLLRPFSQLSTQGKRLFSSLLAFSRFLFLYSGHFGCL